jgi:competence protein ComEC
MFTFIHRPFLYLTPLLCLGVVLADAYAFAWVYSMLFTVVLAIYALLRNRALPTFLQLVLPAFCAILLGAANLEWHRPAETDRQAQDCIALLEIEEIADSESDWRRAVVRMTHVYEMGDMLPINETISVLFNATSLRAGDIVAAHVQLMPIQNKGNPGEFDSEAFWSRQNIYRMAFLSEEDLRFVDYKESGFLQSFWEDARRQCKEVLRKYLPQQVSGLAEALILGDKSRLSSEDRAAFSSAGAMHVLAVSGLHVGIVVYLLMFVFGKMPRILSRTQANLLALVLVWVYAFLTGMSPSVQRAAFMFTLLVLSQSFGRTHDPLNVLFFSAFVLILIDPLILYDIGFQLSYLAMLGILTMYKPLAALVFIRWKWLRKVWEGTAVGIAAQLTTVPLTLYYFHQFPNYFALSNLAVMLLSALILGLGIALFAMQFLHWLSSLIGFALGFLLFALLFSMQWIEQLPAAVATGFELNAFMLVACYLALLVFGLFHAHKKVRYGLAVVALILLSKLQYQRYANWSVRELVVFNHRQPVFCVKQASRIWCFYKNQEGVKEDAERLMADYSKVYPGTVSYIPLEEGLSQIALPKDDLQCALHRAHLELSYGDVSLDIRIGHHAQLDASTVQIDMPYLPPDKNRYSLLQGAYRRALGAEQ